MMDTEFTKSDDYLEAFALLAILTSLLDNNIAAMSLTHQAAADLARGTIPAIISPLEISNTLLSLEDKARQEGLSILLDHDHPMDYYAMPDTVMTNNAGEWTVISHLPLIAPIR